MNGGGDVIDGGEVRVLSAESGVVRGGGGGDDGKGEDERGGGEGERGGVEADDEEREQHRGGVRQEPVGEADGALLARQRRRSGTDVRPLLRAQHPPPGQPLGVSVLSRASHVILFCFLACYYCAIVVM